MSRNYALKAEKREQAGKGVARALRREEKTPAVIYGDNKAPIKIMLPSNDINLEYRKGGMFTHICDLEVEGEQHMVLARDVQLHPVTDRVLHVDFLRVTPKTMIAVMVPVHLINEEDCPGLINKGIINFVRHEVELMCSAINIPEFVEVDMSKVEIGDIVHANDVKWPEGTKPVIQRNFTILTVTEPKKIVEEEAAPAAEGAEGAAAPAADAAAPKAESKAK